MLRPDNPLLGANIMDLAFTLLMIALTVGVVLKVRSTPYTIYSVILAILSLSVTWSDVTRPEVNMPRRLVIIFPIFLYLAIVTDSPRRFRWFFIVSLLSFMVLSGLFINWTFIS